MTPPVAKHSFLNIKDDRSLRNLGEVDPRLAAVIDRAKQLSQRDFIITDGKRTPEKQREYVDKGASLTMDSRHLTGDAIDIAVRDANGNITWDPEAYKEVWGAIKAASDELDTPLVWGGDWKRLRDYGHIQLPRGLGQPQQTQQATQVPASRPRLARDIPNTNGQPITLSSGGPHVVTSGSPRQKPMPSPFSRPSSMFGVDPSRLPGGAPDPAAGRTASRDPGQKQRRGLFTEAPAPLTPKEAPQAYLTQEEYQKRYAMGEQRLQQIMKYEEIPNIFAGLAKIVQAFTARYEKTHAEEDMMKAREAYRQAVMLAADTGDISALGKSPSPEANDAYVQMKMAEVQQRAKQKIDAESDVGQGQAQQTQVQLPDGSIRLGMFEPRSRQYLYQDDNGQWAPVPAGARKVTEGTAAPLSQANYNKLELEFNTQEQSLHKLNNYFKSIGDTNQGLDRWADQVAAQVTTLFNSGQLTPEQLSLQVANGQLQGLLGLFRTEVVGPGVMTEYDAQRVIAALGGDVTALQNRQVVSGILRDIYQYKLQRVQLLQNQLARNAGAYGEAAPQITAPQALGGQSQGPTAPQMQQGAGGSPPGTIKDGREGKRYRKKNAGPDNDRNNWEPVQ